MFKTELKCPQCNASQVACIGFHNLCLKYCCKTCGHAWVDYGLLDLDPAEHSLDGTYPDILPDFSVPIAAASNKTASNNKVCPPGDYDE